jgi:hypothetical protein
VFLSERVAETAERSAPDLEGIEAGQCDGMENSAIVSSVGGCAPRV